VQQVPDVVQQRRGNLCGPSPGLAGKASGLQGMLLLRHRLSPVKGMAALSEQLHDFGKHWSHSRQGRRRP
jgi:hypothetical protein